MVAVRPRPILVLSRADNFQPTGAGQAAIAGDFALVDREVNPVAKTALDLTNSKRP